MTIHHPQTMSQTFLTRALDTAFAWLTCHTPVSITCISEETARRGDYTFLQLSCQKRRHYLLQIDCHRRKPSRPKKSHKRRLYLSSHRMGPRGEEFCDACRVEASFRESDSGPQSSAAGSNNHRIVSVVDDRVCSRAASLQRKLI
jgi:hypothetical protein